MAKPLTDTTRRLRARSLGLVAYGEIGSSLIFALGIVALWADALTPWVLLAVGLLVLVVTLSYAEGATAMPEAGGAATFVRRAFSDPLGFVTGWMLFLDYLVVIALTALFVPALPGGRARVGRHHRAPLGRRGRDRGDRRRSRWCAASAASASTRWRS